MISHRRLTDSVTAGAVKSKISTTDACHFATLKFSVPQTAAFLTTNAAL